MFSCGKDEPTLSSAKAITSFSISGIGAIINESNRTISLAISDTDFTSLSTEITISSNSTINPASGVLQDFTNPITYTVTAEDGSSVDYVVTVISSIFSFVYNGKNYEVIKENKSWEHAISFAVNRGGYLVEINNLEEQNAIFSELDENAGIIIKNTLNEFSLGAVWLGGHDQSTEGTWIWDGNNDGSGEQFWSGGLSGSPIGGLYNNWGNEPDNSSNQDVLSISLEQSSRFAPGEWNDLDGNTNSLFFVIEYN